MPRHPNLTPLTPDQQVLAASAFAKALWVAKIAARRRPQYADEFESQAGWALIEAARSWKPISEDGASSTFATYAERAVVVKMRNTKRFFQPKGFRDPQKTGCPLTIELPGGLPAPQDAGPAQEAAESFEALIAALRPAAQETFRLRFGYDLTLVEIADRMGVSLRTVSNRLGRGLETLRRKLAAKQSA